MLQEARRARADGEDVVIGVVETHGRSETAELVAGLPEIPRRVIEHRGVQLAEFDLDAALARRPARILVDELAHTNAPGSKHVKRWQDVLELLDAGIDVHTTVNVQHIESLGDVVQQITGVRVRETVPDVLIERADDIELVDLSPDELLERLAEGKVYVPDQAQRAVQNFFHKGNLHALRELALRRTAERVDTEVLAYRKQHGIESPWPTAERILVCVGASPASERLLRATKRIAEGLHAEWVAAHVEVIGAPPLGEKDRERVEAHLGLAERARRRCRPARGPVHRACAPRLRPRDQRDPDRGRQADALALARLAPRQPPRLADPRLGRDRGSRHRADRRGEAAAALPDPA